MSFRNLDRYKKNVKAAAAVQRKTMDVQDVGEDHDVSENNNAPTSNNTSPTANPAHPTNNNDPTVPFKSNRTAGVRVLAEGAAIATQQATSAGEEVDPFSVPDSDKNIKILDKNEAKNLQENDMSEVDAAIPQIKGATVVKLVERLTSDKYADPNFTSDFLLTFRSFITPRELLQLLIKRYNIPTPKGLSYGQLQDWKANIQKPIRLRVINFLKNWLEKNWKDFTEDAENGAKLHEFLMEDVRNSGNTSSAEQLAKLLAKKREEPEQERTVIFGNEPAPKPFLPNLKKPSSASSTQLGLMDLHSEEIARQLTLIEYGLYKAIKPWEFFNQSWTKKDKNELSPNIIRMIQRFNKVSNWVATEILKVEQLKQRTSVLAKFLEVAERCRAYNNINALMEILSGIQSSSVFRLKQTWAGLSSKQQQLFEELKELMSRQGNFSKLRPHLKQCNPPLIPYLGVFLTDLTFIEDGNPDLLEGGLVNWVKRRRLATVLKDIQQYQLKPYNLEPVPFIQEFLMNSEPFDEDHCYKLSLLRETRAPEKDTRDSKKFSMPTLPSGLFKKTPLGGGGHSPGTSGQQGNASKKPGNVPEKDEEEEMEEEEEEFEIQYKPGYKFYDKDSEQNILIDKNDNDVDVIKAGTLPKLVERLTYEKYPDTNFLTSFLLTYQTFTTPGELMDLLIMRFHIPPPTNNTPEVLERFKQKKETPIMLRVMNVLKSWVERHFEDLRDDRPLLTKFLEFVTKSMAATPILQRGAENLKIQVANKLETPDSHKEYQFDHEPPKPIFPPFSPDAPPTLLDMHPLELARQFTLMDFELFRSIKPREYLHFVKPSSWSMASIEDPSKSTSEDDDNHQDNLKWAPHIVAVAYRFSDIRDWVATEIIKCEGADQRARILEHFIAIAHHCTTLKNFQTAQEIVTALEFEFILNLKMTWKLVGLPSLSQFIQLRELLSYVNNFGALRKRLSTLDYPCIPYLGMFLQDLAHIREQMPDTIEPGSFVNFAKRQKMATIVTEICNYHLQPFCLEPVPYLQDYLKALDIYELSEMQLIAQQYAQLEGSADIAESWEDLFEKSAKSAVLPVGNSPRGSVSSHQQGSTTPQSNHSNPNSNRNSMIIGSNSSSGNSPRGSVPSPSQSPRGSVIMDNPNNNNTNNNNSAVRTVSSNQIVGGQLRKTSASSKTQLVKQPTEPNVLKLTMMEMLDNDPTFRSEVVSHLGLANNANNNTPAVVEIPAAAVVDNNNSIKTNVDVNALLQKQFPGADVMDWNTVDNQGTIFGWPEEVKAKVLKHNNELLIAPLSSNGSYGAINKAELSVLLRVVQMYESMNRFFVKERPRVVVIGTSIESSTQQIANQIGITFVQV